MKQPKFKDLTFKNYEELNKWLTETSFKKIHLKDFGQDMLTMWVHKSGEILHCDFHSRIYSGKFIDMTKLAVGNNLNIWDNEKKRYAAYGRLLVEALT
jgi:hypothetical protein